MGRQPHYDIKCGQFSQENPFNPFHLSESVSVTKQNKKLHFRHNSYGLTTDAYILDMFLYTTIACNPM